ncbi:MAG: hypothetical protein ACM3O3_12450 [Syntrophothermus sp.]
MGILKDKYKLALIIIFIANTILVSLNYGLYVFNLFNLLFAFIVIVTMLEGIK